MMLSSELQFSEDAVDRSDFDVSIIMPCLNEAGWLPACIANAQEALDLIRQSQGLVGEIIVADNGSTDRSQEIAGKLGARVVRVPRRGYGAALTGGATAARGRYLVMGDADGSYDFRDAVAMVAKLRQGADLCMGSRFKGRIEPGAMPWKNRYIGNPVLTGILNILFRAGVSDAHCGLRAITRASFDDLQLSGDGMEFASEMVIKATLKGHRIVEVPATLRRDLRDRPPHLRPWRDGWRHLRYLLMLSPSWLFALPAALLAGVGFALLALAGMGALWPASASYIGSSWCILAGGLLTLAHAAALLAAAGTLYGIREGYRRHSKWSKAFLGWASLETMLIVGVALVVAGGGILAALLGYWSARHFEAIYTVFPAVLGTSLLVIGMQNILGGFLMAIVNRNSAEFARLNPTTTAPAPQANATLSAGPLVAAPIESR
jgi:glycosyltransferase involved in cell wall biosynthesis